MILLHNPRLPATKLVGRTWEEFNVEVDNPTFFADALCANEDQALFFPDDSDLALEAKAICLQCPVIDECREYALKHDERHGIWGGLSEEERSRMKTGGVRRGIRKTLQYRRERVVAMSEKGFSASEISEYLAISKRQVVRDRAFMRGGVQ